MLTGLGYQLGHELELGALFGCSWNQSDVYGNYGEATDNLLRLGAYGDYQYEIGPVFFQWTTAPTFGIHLLSTERRIAFMNELAKSDRTAFDFTFFNKLGYTVELPRDFYLTPSYALAMSYYHDGEYNETGAVNSRLRVGDYDTWSLLQTLEVKVGKLVRVNDCLAILPEVWGGWEHEYLRSNAATLNFVAAQNGGEKWRAPIVDIPQDRAVLGVGITTLIGDKYEVFGRYDERLWDGGHHSQLAAGISIKF
jgi:outer membrane autotransporter protein